MSIFYTILVVWVIGWVMMVKRNLTMDSPWFSAVFLFLVWPVALVKEMVDYTGESKELAELRKETMHLQREMGGVADQQLGQIILEQNRDIDAAKIELDDLIEKVGAHFEDHENYDDLMKSLHEIRYILS